MTVTVAGEPFFENEGEGGDESERVREQFPSETVRATFRCSSGDPIPGAWTGVPVRALLDAVEIPAETTHLRVRGRDGFTACLPVGDVLDGVLAFERRSLDGETPASDAELPRFVAPGVSGTRTVKSVAAVDPIRLDPDEEAESFEDLQGEA